MSDLNQQVGELIGLVKGQNDKIDRVTDLIPVVAKHEEKHKDFEENWLPVIKDSEKQITRLFSALKWTGTLLGGGATLIGIIVGFF